MTLPHALMWAVIVLVGVPSAWRNPTSAALVLCWIAGETVFVLTGDSLPIQAYLYFDIAVIAVVFAKRRYQPCDRYRSAWHQIACLWLERSPADRIILCSYPAVWYLYVADIHPYFQWHWLWGIAILQLLVAGAEYHPLFLHRSKAVSAKPNAPLFGDEYRRFARVHEGYG